MKSERRRKSLDLMKRSTQSDQIRDMLQNTIKSSLADFSVEGTAEERLQAIMIKAKESGMTTENIFNFFNGGDPNKTHISTKMFLEALEKLGDTFVVFTDEELKSLMNKFDKNGDQHISMSEFKHYCYYEIKSVPWKAERTRLEKTGEMQKLKAMISRRYSGEINNMFTCGKEVLKTSKYFWRTKSNIEIRLFCNNLLNVITMQLYDKTSNIELPNVYVCKNKCEYHNSDLNDAIETAVRVSDALTKEEEEKIKESAYWDFVGKYLIARLKIKDCHRDIMEETEPRLSVLSIECSHMTKTNCIPFLCKLSSKYIL